MTEPLFTLQMFGVIMKSFLASIFLLLANSTWVPAQVVQLPENLTFRITDSGKIFSNPPFKNCHSVSLAETGKATILYVWFGGDHEGAKNVAIYGRFRYTNQKNAWGKIILLAEGKDSAGNKSPCWNPVVFKTKDDLLFLDYKVGPNPREWWAERKTSSDNGKTWSTAERLPSSFLGPIKNKPIQILNRILYPSSTESKDEKTWNIHLETSDGKGKNWSYIPIDCDSFGVIQPTILAYPDGSLQMLSRSRQNKIVETRSYNNGISWSPLSPLNIPNPSSGIDAVTVGYSTQLLVYNPMLSGKDWWAGRSVLKAAVSKNGTDWEDVITLEDHSDGEYSYPAVIKDSKGIVRIAYTDRRTNIKFVDVELIQK